MKDSLARFSQISCARHVHGDIRCFLSRHAKYLHELNGNECYYIISFILDVGQILVAVIYGKPSQRVFSPSGCLSRRIWQASLLKSDDGAPGRGFSLLRRCPFSRKVERQMAMSRHCGECMQTVL